MGGRAFNTWEQIPAGYLESVRLQVPKHTRPSARNQELTGRIIVQNLPEHSHRKVFGDCDETHVQIAARSHGRLSVGEIAASLRSLDGNVFLITGKPAKGYKGTRRTFHPELASKIAKWERSGAEPAPQEIALWDERLYGQGYKPHHSGIEAQRSGVSPAPPIEVPIVNTYITPRSAGNSRIDRELHVPQTREQLEAELSYLEDAQRDLTNPYEAQRARFRYIKVRDELRHLRN